MDDRRAYQGIQQSSDSKADDRMLGSAPILCSYRPMSLPEMQKKKKKKGYVDRSCRTKSLDGFMEDSNVAKDRLNTHCLRYSIASTAAFYPCLQGCFDITAKPLQLRDHFTGKNCGQFPLHD